jgi:anti-sigma B factor antagonist
MDQVQGPDASPPVRLQISSAETPESAVLKLSGELDIASAPLLERAVEGLSDLAQRRVLIDLSELSFMDSTGLRALLQARQLAADTDRELTLRNGPRQVQRVFELSGTAATFTFED